MRNVIHVMYRLIKHSAVVMSSMFPVQEISKIENVKKFANEKNYHAATIV